MGGLPPKKADAQRVVGDKITTILSAFVIHSISHMPSSSPQSPRLARDAAALTSFPASEIASIAIDACISMEVIHLLSPLPPLLTNQRTDILFHKLFPLFQKYDREVTFLRLLEPFIVGRKLVTLPPDVMKRLVASYVEVHLLSSFSFVISVFFASSSSFLCDCIAE